MAETCRKQSQSHIQSEWGSHHITLELHHTASTHITVHLQRGLIEGCTAGARSGIDMGTGPRTGPRNSPEAGEGAMAPMGSIGGSRACILRAPGGACGSGSPAIAASAPPASRAHTMNAGNDILRHQHWASKSIRQVTVVDPMCMQRDCDRV